MAATEAQVSKLRRMIAESDDTTYSDDDLATYIESWPLADSDGNEPDDDDWTATYDLNAAASELWAEKAATVAMDYDFAADGGNYSRSQVHAQYTKQSRYYAARKAIGSVKIYVDPAPVALPVWIGNQAEEDI